MSTIDPQEVEDRKAEILSRIKLALDALDIEELQINSIHLNLKHAPMCPPGTYPSFEAVQHPDGTVSFHWVCK